MTRVSGLGEKVVQVDGPAGGVLSGDVLVKLFCAESLGGLFALSLEGPIELPQLTTIIIETKNGTTRDACQENRRSIKSINRNGAPPLDAEGNWSKKSARR
jgi:hypothetical protein